MIGNFVNNFSEVSGELIDEMEEQLDKGNTEDAKAIAGEIKMSLEKINLHGKRADGIVKSMLQHSWTSSGKKEPTDINVLAEKLRWLGSIRYTMASLIYIFKNPHYFACASIDNKVIDSNFCFIIACNTMHTGKAMKMAPKNVIEKYKAHLLNMYGENVPVEEEVYVIELEPTKSSRKCTK